MNKKKELDDKIEQILDILCGLDVSMAQILLSTCKKRIEKQCDYVKISQEFLCKRREVPDEN